MPNHYPDSCLIQFAKAPLPGCVKTRLQSALGEEGCLKLHQALVEHQFAIHTHQICDFELWCSEHHSFFDELTAASNIPIYEQQGNGLGERMLNMFTERLLQYSYVILVGSDCPFLDADYVSEAIESLKKGADAVFGPATDGGYVLIGLSQTNTALFENIDWGTEQVMTQTRLKMADLGWYWEEMRPLSDIDRPDDLELLFCDENLRHFLD